MADKNSACIEKTSNSSPNESQRQIPFDAGKNFGWAESATAEESRIAEISTPPTWGGLVSRRVECLQVQFEGILSVMAIFTNRAFGKVEVPY
jgi:hypothetical protein